MKKLILSLLVLSVLLIPITAQAFQYKAKINNKPYPHVVFFSTNGYMVKGAGININILPIIKADARNSNNKILQYKALQMLAFINYKSYMTKAALYYINTDIKKINNSAKAKYFLKKALYLKSKILARQKAISIYFKGIKLAREKKYRQGLKYIKESVALQPSIIKHLPVIKVEKTIEYLIRKNKLDEQKFKAKLGNNRYKAIAIINNYCSRHNGCEVKGYKHDQNGYYTYYYGSFVVSGDPTSGNNFMITQSLFSTQLQNQLVFILKQNGYSNASTMNLTTSFVSYITPPGKEVLSRIQGLTDMVSSGNLKDFNELVSLFVKHFIKINK